MQHLNDEQLMQLAGQGRRAAFEMLYDRYFDKLVHFAKQFTKDSQKAEDIVQEVFMQIIEKPMQFEQGRKFSTWVYTVTGNACKNAWRNEQNRSRILAEQVLPTQMQSTSAQLQVDYKILQERIQHVFKELNEKEQQLFVLRFEHELPLNEIAEILQIPNGSVKSGIYYLLKKMSYYLKEFTDEK